MPQRLQRKRTRGWRMPEGAVCVTRPGPWGNPFENAFEFRAWLTAPQSIVTVLHYLLLSRSGVSTEKAEHRRQWILEHLPELRGKDLLCWCSVSECGREVQCHADVLLQLANDPLTHEGKT